MKQPLANKVVIITGASSGIGAATARALAQHGCKLTLAARSVERLEALAEELGRAQTLVAPTDVTDAAQVAAMVERTIAHFGRVDVLFANAGIYIPGQVAEGDPDAWARLMDINIDGVLRPVHAVLAHMMAQKAGDILVTSSISGFVDIHWEPVYSASKHAIQSFVHTLRRQVAQHGIRVGAVAPGLVANELWGFTEPERIAEMVEKHAGITSEDVAEAVVFMLSRPSHVTIRDLVILPQQQDI
ncbi:MAG TPA: SDR family oxidoreductase [Chloroflexi bacterium]|nr:SDR family oxidoreductase [Chloroflexota bacterium]